MNINTVNLTKNSVIVVSYDSAITREQKDWIIADIQEQIGDVPVLVLASGLKLTIVEKSA